MLKLSRGGYSGDSASSRYFSSYLSFLLSKLQHERSIRFVNTFRLDCTVLVIFHAPYGANRVAACESNSIQ